MTATPSLPAWLATVHHDGSAEFVTPTYPRLGDRARLRLRVAAAAPVERVFLRTFPDGEQAFAPMTRREDGSVAWWEVETAVREPRVHYRFVIESADGLWWFTAAGPTGAVPLDNTDFTILADYAAPSWLPGAVFYQIFPDRFANGDPALDPQPGDYELGGLRPRTLPWGQPPADGAFDPLLFYGGDLPGITQRLDYLSDLGINAVYLNPVFTAYSNHKYDVADYYHVDAHFGGDDALVALRRALHARGIRCVLDIVPNHCGYWHPWFQAALADPAAPQADYFTFANHPDDYASWLGVWSLPKLNYQSAALRARIYGADDAVFRHWLREPFALDGWRIDVANMLARHGETQLGVEIARAIRQAVKETAPDAYLLGENFFDASPQLQGDQWDGVMNYMGFTFPLLYWLRGYTMQAWGMHDTIRSSRPWLTADLLTTWRSRLAAVPWVIALQQLNLLDSHDTERVRTQLGGNDALHRLAAVVQFTFPGVPGLYYGDEIGLTDVPGLGQRGCMVWDSAEWDHDLLAFYRDLIALRRREPALQTGGFQIVAGEADCVAFLRTGGRRVLVIANRSPQPRSAEPLPVAHAGLADGTRLLQWRGDAELTVHSGLLPLPPLPQGATVWLEA